MAEAALAKAIEKFIALRDEKREMQDRHKEELAPINEAMGKIENAVQRILLKQGATNSKTPAGTAYLSTTTKPKVVDWSELKPFLVQNDLLDMMTRALSASAVNEYYESTGELPPGVTVTSETNCRFKR